MCHKRHQATIGALGVGCAKPALPGQEVDAVNIVIGFEIGRRGGLGFVGADVGLRTGDVNE